MGTEGRKEGGWVRGREGSRRFPVNLYRSKRNGVGHPVEKICKCKLVLGVCGMVGDTPAFFYPVGTEGVRRRHFYPLADSVRATGKNPGTGRKNPRFFVETPGHIMENLYYP